MCVNDSNLLVRRATDDDVDAIIELNRDGNGEDAAVEVRQGFDGAAFAPGDYAVVVDGTRVVSTLGLLRLHFALGDVVIPTGQPEFVVTHPDYRGRGLVRTLMDLVHGWSAERGDLLLVIAGIPYFYRQFGYDYGIPFPSERLVPPETKLDPCDAWETRPATVDDIYAVRALQDEVQSKADLRLPFEPEVWPVLMKLPHVELAVAEDAGKQIGAVGRIRPIRSGHVRVTNVAARTQAAARALMLRARHARPGASLVVADRVGGPISAVLAAGSLPTGTRNWLYARIPDPAALLSHLRPVLSARLSTSSMAGESGQADISLYRSSVRVAYAQGQVTNVDGTMGVQPDDDDRTALPPDLLVPMLFGPEGVAAVEQHPDVNLGHDRELLRVLFPPLQADVLMW